MRSVPIGNPFGRTRSPRLLRWDAPANGGQVRTVWIMGILIAGCEDWPRASHLPAGTGAVPGTVDPGSLVDMTWRDRGESLGINDQPTQAEAEPLTLGKGLVVSGVLWGVGWSNKAVPEVLTDPACPDAEGSRSALGDGDYVGDVDFLIVEPASAGTLCASNRLEAAAAVGWDLVPWWVDRCGIPLDAAQDADGEPLGVYQAGATGGWYLDVAAGDRIAVGLGGYSPPDLDRQLDYALALSMVPTPSEGLPAVCPVHPQ